MPGLPLAPPGSLRYSCVMPRTWILVLIACLSALAPAQDAPRGPNVVLIYADDLGYAELGAYGQERIRTPNIDRLAAEGMRFTQYYSGSPVCAPSRCVLLTGRHTGHAAIRGNFEVPGTRWHDPESPEGQAPMPADEITLAERLKSRGYTTGAFGKWGLGGPGSEGHPCYQGFDHFYGYLCQRVAHNYYPTHLWRNHDVDILPGNTFFRSAQKIDAPLDNEDAYNQRFRGKHYAPTEIAQEMLMWLDASDDKPFFLYYAPIIPHLALQAPQEWVDRYPAEWDDKHYLGNAGYLPNARPRATYAAMISYLDDVVGRILAHLDESGLSEDTIVLFTSDNGPSWVGGVDLAFFGSAGPWRGRKAELWEGGIRVPLIARWPGHIAPASTSDLPCVAYDLAPTVLDFIALPQDAGGTASSRPSPDSHYDGLSLAPNPPRPRRTTTARFHLLGVPRRPPVAGRPARWTLQGRPQQSPQRRPDGSPLRPVHRPGRDNQHRSRAPRPGRAGRATHAHPARPQCDVPYQSAGRDGAPVTCFRATGIATPMHFYRESHDDRGVHPAHVLTATVKVWVSVVASARARWSVRMPEY